MSSQNDAVRSLVFLHHVISAFIGAVVIVALFYSLSYLNGEVPTWWLGLSLAGIVGVCSIPIVRAMSDKKAGNDYQGWIGIGILCVSFWGAGEIHDLTIEKTVAGAKSTLDTISQQGGDVTIETPKVEVQAGQVASDQNQTATNNSTATGPEKPAQTDSSVDNQDVDQSSLPLVEGVAYDDTAVTMPSAPKLDNVEFWWRLPGETGFKGKLVASSPPTHPEIEVAGFVGKKLVTKVTPVTKS